eukprot:746391-Hanusia_phi.AAC.9
MQLTLQIPHFKTSKRVGVEQPRVVLHCRVNPKSHRTGRLGGWIKRATMKSHRPTNFTSNRMLLSFPLLPGPVHPGTRPGPATATSTLSARLGDVAPKFHVRTCCMGKEWRE